ncbi:MAG: hypothetical protein GF355_05240 [Candidatus Eisenbacteria bacterium]|nr:hypothetical protein [Candidatus Eisenbacteria bacterium]
MSPQEFDKLTPEQDRARRAVRDLGRPMASAQFRERLKEDFISGTLLADPQRQITVPRRRIGWGWLLGFGLAGAAAVVLIALALTGGAPDWRLMDPIPGAHLIVDGVEVPLDDAAAVDRLLEPGVRLSVPDTVDVTLVSPGYLLVQLTPGSEGKLPELPGRWFNRHITTSVTAGEVRYNTGDDFAGGRLTIETSEARVVVLGSTIAVIKGEDSTCVCVYEGNVKIGPMDGPMMEVPEGRRGIVYGDERPPLQEEITSMERMKLQMLQDLYNSQLAEDE